MKTSKEWAEIYMISPILTLREAFKMVQEEAIKETVKACSEAAMTECTPTCIQVNKQSILDVEQQLKSQP